MARATARAPAPRATCGRAVSQGSEEPPAREAEGTSGRTAGYWCPVLHAHLPYVRHPEHREFLEECWLFEAITEAYVPLLAMLDRLRADGVFFRLTLTLTPTLLAMLRDPLLVGRYERHLDRLVAVAEGEAERTRRHAPRFAHVARFHRDMFARTRRQFRDEYGADLVAAFVRHAREGSLEILTSAATHAVLPLLEAVPEAVRAQVRLGAEHSRRHLGRQPLGFWLPECAYAPGQEAHLAGAGVRFSFLEEHGVAHAHPRPTHGALAPILSPGGVVFFGRDRESSHQVWSAEVGYPGDPLYREFYKDAAWDVPVRDLGELAPGGTRRGIGLKYHRVTGPVDLSQKETYVPEEAAARARAHAAHFVEARLAQVRRHRPAMDRPPLVVSPYDAELFGHWWFEGPLFLEEVFRRLAAEGAVRAVTPLEYLDRHPDCEVAQPPPSTWGARGYAEVWLNPANDWIYPHLDVAGERMVELARRFTNPPVLQRRALNQAARELLLAQASDWPFIMTMGTTVEYARKRVRDHVGRFTFLYRGLAGAGVDEAALREMEERDAVFPEADFRVYR
ncbi:MAG TPA: 1,4-alpha-glucan branching protein domain-containing protein [Vicinamibacteria bacterium]|nr:1,4-alpha-glucan branching protein domain-containing protein [Vicinamibacteria bacterium]